MDIVINILPKNVYFGYGVHIYIILFSRYGLGVGSFAKQTATTEVYVNFLSY